MKNKCLFRFLLFLAMFLIPTFASADEVKNALLIANSDYGKDIGSLTQPVSEARNLKRALESIGFNVTLIENANRERMEDTLFNFKEKCEKEGGIALFHYGGHAVQIDEVLYLIPVNTKVEDSIGVIVKCVNVTNVMKCMCGDANVIVFDTARDNSFLVEDNRRSSKRVTGFGESTSRLSDSSIVIYSTEPGHAAQDGIFTSILVEHITEKNVSAVDLFNKVYREVSKKTEGKQNPVMYNHMIFHIYLGGVDK